MHEEWTFSLMPHLKAICYTICRYSSLTLMRMSVNEEEGHVEDL